MTLLYHELVQNVNTGVGNLSVQGFVLYDKDDCHMMSLSEIDIYIHVCDIIKITEHVHMCSQSRI